jgi:hypothetical protein
LAISHGQQQPSQTESMNTGYGMKINLVQIVLAAICTILVSVLDFTRANDGSLTSVADQWFDSYGDLSWEDEKIHLDNFAIELQNYPDLFGYIIVFAGRRACVGESRNRALRAKKYVTEIRGIQASRIKWIDGGYREELTVILQPSRGVPEFSTSLSLKPSEVRIIKNCKPKIAKPKKRLQYIKTTT